MEKKHSVIFSRPLSPKEVDGTKINISINAPLAGLTESHGCLVHIPLYYTVGFWCQTIHKKFLRRFDTIFGLKMMVKSGLEKLF
jgi:hypothetical protein